MRCRRLLPGRMTPSWDLCRVSGTLGRMRGNLTLIGSGITDYLDPFIADECAERTVSAIGEYLAKADFDLCAWQDLSAT